MLNSIQGRVGFPLEGAESWYKVVFGADGVGDRVPADLIYRLLPLNIVLLFSKYEQDKRGAVGGVEWGVEVREAVGYHEEYAISYEER